MPVLARLGVAWIVGIALARWLNLPWPVIAIASLPSLGAISLYRHTLRAQTWAILGLALTAGAVRFAFFQPTFGETHTARSVFSWVMISKRRSSRSWSDYKRRWPPRSSRATITAAKLPQPKPFWKRSTRKSSSFRSARTIVLAIPRRRC